MPTGHLRCCGCYNHQRANTPILRLRLLSITCHSHPSAATPTSAPDQVPRAVVDRPAPTARRTGERAKRPRSESTDVSLHVRWRRPSYIRVAALGDLGGHPPAQAPLRHGGSKLLRERLDYRSTGTIGDRGLVGPAELTYYAGSGKLVPRSADGSTGNATRIPSFGRERGRASRWEVCWPCCSSSASWCCWSRSASSSAPPPLRRRTAGPPAGRTADGRRGQQDDPADRSRRGTVRLPARTNHRNGLLPARPALLARCDAVRPQRLPVGHQARSRPGRPGGDSRAPRWPCWPCAASPSSHWVLCATPPRAAAETSGGGC